eukprot:Pgem_evm1s15401
MKRKKLKMNYYYLAEDDGSADECFPIQAHSSLKTMSDLEALTLLHQPNNIRKVTITIVDKYGESQMKITEDYTLMQILQHVVEERGLPIDQYILQPLDFLVKMQDNSNKGIENPTTMPTLDLSKTIAEINNLSFYLHKLNSKGIKLNKKDDLGSFNPGKGRSIKSLDFCMEQTDESFDVLVRRNKLGLKE